MKKYLLTTCLSVLLIGAQSFAQGMPTDFPPPVEETMMEAEIPPEFGKEMPHRMRGHKNRPAPEDFAKELGLTEEQKAKADALHEKMRREMAPIKEQMDALKEKAHALRETNRKEFESLLTDEQKARLESMKPAQDFFKRKHHRPPMTEEE